MSGRDVAIAAMLGAEEYRICNGSAGNYGMRDDACLQPGYLSGGRSYPESGTEKTVPRQTRICRKLHEIHRRRAA